MTTAVVSAAVEVIIIRVVEGFDSGAADRAIGSESSD
jgi:hypothetical protein